MSLPRLLSLSCLLPALALVGCGEPIKSKEALLRPVAASAIPMTAAKGAALRLFGSGIDKLPEASYTVKGGHSGEAKLSVNPVGVIVGLIGKSVLVDVEYDNYSEDGENFLDGTVSTGATFDYQAVTGDAAFADLRFSFVGQFGLSGQYSDDLDMNVIFTARFGDLSLRDEGIEFRLDGTIDTNAAQFKFDHEDLSVLWQVPSP